MKKVSIPEARWKEAQQEEKEMLDKAEYLAIIEMRKKRFQKYMEVINSYIKISNQMKVLDIGCKQYGMINYLNEGEKYGLDPLIDPSHPYFKGKNINYIQGVGESLPFKDGFFDIIFTTNTLDHMRSPKETLKEIYRSLKDDGFLVLSVYTYSSINKIYKKIKSFLGHRDIPHPFCFNFIEVKKLIEAVGFKVIVYVRFPLKKSKTLKDMIWERTFCYIEKKIIDPGIKYHSEDSLFICVKNYGKKQ